MIKKKKALLRNKADKLLQQYIRLKYDDCLVCGNDINCGHHFITKASSNALRYYLPNIIPICKHCHCLVHSQPHLVEPKICYALGQDWYDDLINVKRAGIKENECWYNINIDTLQSLVTEISGKDKKVNQSVQVGDTFKFNGTKWKMIASGKVNFGKDNKIDS